MFRDKAQIKSAKLEDETVEFHSTTENAHTAGWDLDFWSLGEETRRVKQETVSTPSTHMHRSDRHKLGPRLEKQGLGADRRFAGMPASQKWGNQRKAKKPAYKKMTPEGSN